MIEVLADAYPGTVDNPIPIGQVNEHESRTIEFYVANLRLNYGEGTCKLLVMNPLEAEYHEATIDEYGGIVYWKVTSSETKHAGRGLVELHYIPTASPDTLYKSKIKNTVVFDSLYGEST